MRTRRSVVVVFDRARRNHLDARLRRAVGLPDPFVQFLVSQIAAANYPTRAEAPMILPPIIDRAAVARLTADFLDRGAGTIATLYRAIWGLSPRAYVAQVNPDLGEEPN